MDRKKIANELKLSLQEQLGSKLKDVVLFGSSINQKVTDDSDVDILIVLEGNYDYLMKRKINDICYEFDLKYDVFIDNQLISLDELNHGLRGKHPVFKNALQYGYHA